MMSEEDRIKYTIYIKFQEQYFANRKDNKTKFMRLSSEERLEFCRLQKIYVEEEYQKKKYNLK